MSDVEKRTLWDCLYLQSAETADLLAHVKARAAQPWVYPLFCFAAYTGTRRAEMLRVLVADVDFDGKTVLIRGPIEAPGGDDRLESLVVAANLGHIDGLLILGGNPVYDAPADSGFVAALAKIKFKAHLSQYENETSKLCDWYLPESHFLEAWSDTRAYDGTVSIVQPLIQPLHDTKSAHELLADLAGKPASGLDILKDFWKTKTLPGDFEKTWEQSLNDGVVPCTKLPTVVPKLEPGLAARLGPEPGKLDGFELVLRPDPTIWDGRYANNGWLQELPKPVTKTTWENTVQMSVATAQKVKVQNGDVVELRYAT